MKKVIYVLAAMLAVACGRPSEMRVMSFNIRYDNPEDGPDGWAFRKDAAAKAILDNDADIVGTQEVLHNQLEDLCSRLPLYGYEGVGRSDGKTQGEFCALFYKTGRFDLIRSGNFWLSEHPDSAGSIGWDAACERVVTWALLRDKGSLRELLAVNTHLDHVGSVARRKSVALLIGKITELADGRPVILTGDFNSAPDSDVITAIKSCKKGPALFDSRDLGTVLHDAPGTFHAFGRVAEERRERIDYIFVSEGVDVRSYEVLPEKMNGTYISDHTPIMAVVSLL